MGRTSMNRWAVQRYTVAGIWLRDRAERLTGRLTARTATPGDRGQTSVEYLGIVVVIVVIIGVLAGTTDIGDKIKSAIISSINKITK